MSITVTPIPRLTVLTTPAFTLGTANAAGAANTAVASNSTLLVFDAVNPANVGTSAVGTATVASHRDHVHGGTAALITADSAAAKVWSYMSSSGANTKSYNVTSTARNSTGNFTVTIANDMDSVNYSVVSNAVGGSGADEHSSMHSLAAGSYGMNVIAGGASADRATCSMVFGDLA